MRIGMVGLGRMGANMVRRLLKGGHECVAYDQFRRCRKASRPQGAKGASSLAELVAGTDAPRASSGSWCPRASSTPVIAQLRPLLKKGDIIIDGGNSHYHDDIRRAEELQSLPAFTMSMSAPAAACSASSTASA